MTQLQQYADKYRNIRAQRRDGILQLTLHTGGGPLQWSLEAHREVGEMFHDVAEDCENKVVILTGTGAAFSEPRVTPENPILFRERIRFEDADRVVREGKALLMNLLSIDVPVISAINGPAWRHGELPLLADIVLATESTCFQDSAHFPGGLVPGDGMHVVMPLLLGFNRARYFLLTGQTLDARSARDLGLVAEILPEADLLPRAWKLAEQIAARPSSLVRMTRAVLTEKLKREVQDMLGFGLHAEFFALSHAQPT